MKKAVTNFASINVRQAFCESQYVWVCEAINVANSVTSKAHFLRKVTTEKQSIVRTCRCVYDKEVLDTLSDYDNVATGVYRRRSGNSRHHRQHLAISWENLIYHMKIAVAILGNIIFTCFLDNVNPKGDFSGKRSGSETQVFPAQRHKQCSRCLHASRLDRHYVQDLQRK